MASASKPESVQRLLPWWGKLAHRALLARTAKQIDEVIDENETDASALRASGVRVRPAVDADASA
jgi:hypothetical protein